MKLTITIVAESSYVDRLIALLRVLKRWRDRYPNAPSLSIHVEGKGGLE
jgi:hypothetical protein